MCVHVYRKGTIYIAAHMYLIGYAGIMFAGHFTVDGHEVALPVLVLCKHAHVSTGIKIYIYTQVYIYIYIYPIL